MRHNKKGRKLGTDWSHTKAMKRSLVKALFLNDRIKTVESRAKEIRPDVDKIITWAKKGDLHSRRLAIAALGNDKELVREIFEKVEQGLFADRQGGYTRIIKKLLEGVQVCLKTDFFANREELTAQADKILFTGMIDEFYDYCYGELEYRSLRFETEVLDMGNYQGNAVVNYTDYEVPYTRIIEHKHFEFGTQPKTVITREYPAAWEKGKEPYYPINDPKNDELFDKYERRALEEKNVLFGGRLGMYRYMDMDKVIEEALNMAETELTYEEV